MWEHAAGPFILRRDRVEFASYNGWLRVLLAPPYHEPWLKGTNTVLGSRSCNEFSHRVLYCQAALLIGSPLENSPSPSPSFAFLTVKRPSLSFHFSLSFSFLLSLNPWRKRARWIEGWRRFQLDHPTFNDRSPFSPPPCPVINRW